MEQVLQIAQQDKVSIYNLPSFIDDGSTLTIHPIARLETHSNTPLNLVRWMPFGAFDYLAVTDFLSNIYLFKETKLQKVYLSTHSRIITELLWLFELDQNPLPDPHSQYCPQPYLLTTSLDGYLKLWSLSDQSTPLYQQSYSQRWLFSAFWDPSLNALIMNFESKFFPQRIFSLQRDQIKFRKLNFYLDNVLLTRSSVGRDYVYSMGIDGMISRVAKRDYCRVIERKHKEKLRNLSVQRVATFVRNEGGGVCVEKHQMDKVQEHIEVVDEAYLYAEREVAGVGLELSPVNFYGQGGIEVIATSLRGEGNVMYLIQV